MSGLIVHNLEEPSMTTLIPHPAAGCRRNPLDPKTGISRRQRQALLLAANGNTNALIAAWMHCGEDTVSGLLRKVYRKLGATDRAQAVAIALRTGVLRLDEIVLPEAVERSAPSVPA